MSDQFNQTDISPNPEPVQQPEMSQKPKSNTWIIALIVAVIVIVVGLATYAAYYFYIDRPVVDIKRPEQTIAHQDYKQVLALKGVGYTEEGEKFKGIPFKQPGEMGRFSYYFDKNDKNDFYIFRFQLAGSGMVKILSSAGDIKFMFDPTEVVGQIEDLAVDDKGNIFIYDGMRFIKPLHRYTSDGVHQEEISIKENIPTGTAFLPMYIVNNKIYKSDGEMSHLIGAINNGVLEKVAPLSFPGILGSVSGNIYNSGLERWKRAKMDILDFSSRTIIKTIDFEIEGIVSIEFLGEDQDNNIYIETEKTTGNEIITEMHKFDSSGKLLTILDLSEVAKPYVFRPNRHRLVDKNGDIWQLVPEDDGYGWCINKWSTIY